MNIEDFFNKDNIVDLSFFNFRNAITAAYYSDKDLKVLQVNDNFRTFFPILGNVSNVYFPDVLEQLGLPGNQIDDFVKGINETGSVLIPQVHIQIDDEERIYSLLSTRTNDSAFSYLNGVQGQFVDRTQEWNLRREREELIEQKGRDQELIVEKTVQLENLATRLAKYLSPQIYQTIFSGNQELQDTYARKNLTIFFSDIFQFTDLSDTLEPEKLAKVINSYLSEMTEIALECGGTIDKFIGDAILVFFGDPESQGETNDALGCVEMALRMQQRIQELQDHWKKQSVTNGLKVRMGITTGYCTVGNFGSNQRMDYTVLGKPVNLAARLESLASPGEILISDSTFALIEHQIRCTPFDEIRPKGFARPVKIHKVEGSSSLSKLKDQSSLYHSRDHVQVNIVDSSDIPAAVRELKQIQKDISSALKNKDTID